MYNKVDNMTDIADLLIICFPLSLMLLLHILLNCTAKDIV